MRRRIWKIKEQLALNSECEQYNAIDARQRPLWRANAAHELLRSRRWEPEGRPSWQSRVLGAEGRERNK